MFTIRKSQDLDALFKQGGPGTLEEGRLWSEAQNPLHKAQGAKQPFLVLFAAGEAVGDLLYYAELEEISVNHARHTSEFKFSNMTKFEKPGPHKTELVVVRTGKHISKGHIRPYSLCKTPSVLLGGEPGESKPTPTADFPELTLKNVRGETCDAVYRATRKRMMGDNQIFGTEALDEQGTNIPEGRQRISQKLSDIFQKDYQLGLTESEIALCETVDDLVDLVRAKLS